MADDEVDNLEYYFVYSWFYQRWEAIHFGSNPYEPDEYWFLPLNIEILPNLKASI